MLKRSSPPVGAKGNEVKHLANVSCQVTARDPSDATLCQDDTQREEKASLDNIYIITNFFFLFHRGEASSCKSTLSPVFFVWINVQN